MTASLQPVLHPRVRDFLAQGRAKEWLNSFGSPLHVVFPQIAAENAAIWRRDLSSHYEKIDVRFALKSCKSAALLNTFASQAIGADCSSPAEMLKAVENAVAPCRISLSGPHKTDKEYRMAIALGAAIHVDSPDIAVKLIKLGRNQDLVPKAVVRLRPHGQEKSRFGMSRDDVLETARMLAKSGCELEGIAFHLNGYDTAARIRAALEALQIVAILKSDGLRCKCLDIGGGFPVNYLLDPNFEQSLAGMPSWRDSATPVTYPYHNVIAGSTAAEVILQGILSDEKAAKLIRELDLNLIFQPGRSLVDQSGISIFSIIGQKKTAWDLSIVVLDGMSFSLSERWFGSDFLPAPFLLSQSGFHESVGAEYALAGSSCLDDDIVRQLAVGFTVSPSSGDGIAFVNTAGYQMDSNESEFHQRCLPRKIAALEQDGKWIAVLDEEFLWRSSE